MHKYTHTYTHTLKIVYVAVRTGNSHEQQPTISATNCSGGSVDLRILEQLKNCLMLWHQWLWQVDA